MRVLDLFSGIGGFSLGLERAGMTTVAFCEIDPFCRKVLRKHWPSVAIHDDIRTFRPWQVDVVCGGWPCQTHSQAARGRNVYPDMWPELERVIDEARPRYFIGENVARVTVDRTCAGLERIGYSCRPYRFRIPFRGHIRDRIYFVAHADGNREPRLSVDEVAGLLAYAEIDPATSAPLGMDARLPGELDRLRALGNSVVPQVVEQIGRAIMGLNG